MVKCRQEKKREKPKMLTKQQKRELTIDTAYEIFKEIRAKETKGQSTRKLDKELYEYLDEANIKMDDLHEVHNGSIDIESLY